MATRKHLFTLPTGVALPDPVADGLPEGWPFLLEVGGAYELRVVRGTGFAPVPAVASVTAVAATPYVVLATDDYVVATVTDGTVTLPDPAVVGAGWRVVVKNADVTALTVGAAAGTIDGAATDSLAQWESATYLSNGTLWYVL